jgi:hypothetical protein
MDASAVRYCLYAWSPFEEDLFNEHGNKPVPISGLYNWASCMGGVRKHLPTSASAEGLTHIHINVTTLSLQAIPFLRKICTDVGAKLIANVDYALELWTQNLKFPHLLASMLDQCDYVFSVNGEMSWALETLTRRPIHTIPHPTDGEALRRLRGTPPPPRPSTPSLATVLHRYDMNLMPAWLAIQGLTPHNTLLGTVEHDHSMFPLFNRVKLNLPFPDFCAELLCHRAVFDSYTLLSYGRVQVECAFLGVPCVGFDCVDAQRAIWPELSVPVNSLREARARLCAVLSSPDIGAARPLPAAVERAQALYSYSACRGRMLAMLSGRR